MKLTTDAQLAEMLGVTVEDVRLKCRSQWPCVRPKRGVWRFTDAHVQAIVDMATVSPSKRKAATSGQSARSVARSA